MALVVFSYGPIEANKNFNLNIYGRLNSTSVTEPKTILSSMTRRFPKPQLEDREKARRKHQEVHFA